MHGGGGGKILYLGRRKIDDAIYPADCGKFSLFPSFSLPSSFPQIPDNILDKRGGENNYDREGK